MAEMDLARIKRNVGKMVDQGAPETDIDTYIAGEGTTVDAIKAFKPGPKPDIGVDMAKGATYGFNEGIDATLNMVAAPIRAPINYVSEKLGYGEAIPELQLARRANVAGPAETTAGRTMQAIGEVAGGSVAPTAGLLTAGRMMGAAAPGIISQYAAAPARAVGIDAVSSVGAGAGISVARENDLGPTGEIALGLAGGFLAPNALNVAARTYGGVTSAGRFANRMVERARDPEAAAFRDISDEGTRAGFDFNQARATVAPPVSANLQARGATQDDMVDMISRHLAGENADDIAQSYAHLVDAQGRPLTGATVRRYANSYRDMNPTDMNTIDLAKEQIGTGRSLPLANQARTDMAISDDPVAGDRLITRQREQPGRTADIIEQSRINGRTLEEELQRLETTAVAEARTAYDAVRQQAQPINIGPVIRSARGRALRRQGEVGDKVNEAVDLFFQPELRQAPQSPMTALRITEAEEALNAAIQGGADPQRIARLERRLNALREQDEFSRPLRETDVGSPITDVGRFIDARQELDQMIRRSMQDGQPTPLTAELTQLRTQLNVAARRNNPSLTTADAQFSENRSIENILQRGRDLGKKLTPQTRQALRDFRDMTPTQQEAMRVSFEDHLANEALGVQRGHAAADKFNSEAFDQIVARLYPRSAGRDVFERGQRLLRNLRREAITTETARDALSGSRTAPLKDRMEFMMEGPRAAADLVTGRFGKLLENLSNRLTRQIGQEAARHRVRILTETDPAAMLTNLTRLAREAGGSAERQAYVAALRDFRRAGWRMPSAAGAVTSSARERKPLEVTIRPNPLLNPR